MWRRLLYLCPFSLDAVKCTAPENGNRFRWPCRSVVARLLELRVRIPPAKWLFVYCECCVVQMKAFAKGRSLVQGSPTDCVCVCVPLSVVRCCDDPLHLQRLGTQRHVEKWRSATEGCITARCHQLSQKVRHIAHTQNCHAVQLQ